MAMASHRNVKVIHFLSSVISPQLKLLSWALAKDWDHATLKQKRG